MDTVKLAKAEFMDHDYRIEEVRSGETTPASSVGGKKIVIVGELPSAPTTL